MKSSKELKEKSHPESLSPQKEARLLTDWQECPYEILEYVIKPFLVYRIPAFGTLQAKWANNTFEKIEKDIQEDYPELGQIIHNLPAEDKTPDFIFKNLPKLIGNLPLRSFGNYAYGNFQRKVMSADCEQAMFARCTLDDASLRGNFANSDFSYCDLTHTILFQAKLDGANWYGTILEDNEDFAQCCDGTEIGSLRGLIKFKLPLMCPEESLLARELLNYITSDPLPWLILWSITHKSKINPNGLLYKVINFILLYSEKVSLDVIFKIQCDPSQRRIRSLVFVRGIEYGLFTFFLESLDRWSINSFLVDLYKESSIPPLEKLFLELHNFIKLYSWDKPYAWGAWGPTTYCDEIINIFLKCKYLLKQQQQQQSLLSQSPFKKILTLYYQRSKNVIFFSNGELIDWNKMLWMTYLYPYASVLEDPNEWEQPSFEIQSAFQHIASLSVKAFTLLKYVIKIPADIIMSNTREASAQKQEQTNSAALAVSSHRNRFWETMETEEEKSQSTELMPLLGNFK